MKLTFLDISKSFVGCAWHEIQNLSLIRFLLAIGCFSYHFFLLSLSSLPEDLEDRAASSLSLVYLALCRVRTGSLQPTGRPKGGGGPREASHRVSFVGPRTAVSQIAPLDTHQSKGCLQDAAVSSSWMHLWYLALGFGFYLTFSGYRHFSFLLLLLLLYLSINFFYLFYTKKI